MSSWGSAALLASALFAPDDTCAIRREFDVRTEQGHVLVAEIISADGRAKPTVVLISGAGPHTRDYSTDTGSRTGGNRAFHLITVALVRAGYSVIRFDERGTGSSTGDYSETATTATLADDVGAIISVARQLPEVDGDRFILLGHSEGGAIAPLVASRDSTVRALVLLSAPAWGGDRIMASQHRWLIANGDRSDRPQTSEEREALLEAEHADRTANDPWYQFFLTYDPLPAIRRVDVPVLIMHGDRDWKVTVEQAHELAAAAREAGNDRVTVAVFPGHSHSLAPLDARGQEGSFSSGVVLKLLDWLHEELPGRPAGRACGSSAASPASARVGLTEVGIDVFGLSWHYDSRTYWDGIQNVRYQETNPGLGLHLRLGGSGRHVWMLKAGGYEDSMRNLSLFAGPVWQYRLARGLHAGGGVLLFRSKSYVSPVIPLPLVTYRAGPVGLNITWVPPGNEYASGALAFFGTVVVWRRQ